MKSDQPDCLFWSAYEEVFKNVSLIFTFWGTRACLLHVQEQYLVHIQRKWNLWRVKIPFLPGCAGIRLHRGVQAAARDARAGIKTNKNSECSQKNWRHVAGLVGRNFIIELTRASSICKKRCNPVCCTSGWHRSSHSSDKRDKPPSCSIFQCCTSIPYGLALE